MCGNQVGFTSTKSSFLALLATSARAKNKINYNLLFDNIRALRLIAVLAFFVVVFQILLMFFSLEHYFIVWIFTKKIVGNKIVKVFLLEIIIVLFTFSYYSIEVSIVIVQLFDFKFCTKNIYFWVPLCQKMWYLQNELSN